MRDLIMVQSFGAIAQIALTQGLVLLYLMALGISPARVLLLLSLPPLCQALFSVPGAYLGDTIGKKFVAYIGIAGTIIGFGLLSLAATLSKKIAPGVAGLGIVIYACGYALFICSWFAIIHPIAPAERRNRFFSVLRLSWQLISMAFVGICGLVLGQDAKPWVFQVMLGIATLGLINRLFFYRRVPELEKSMPSKTGMIQSSIEIIRAPRYLSFCAYWFLLSLFTGACLMTLNLLEKTTLNFGDNQIVWLGNLAMLGGLAGFWLGGLAADRFGTKGVFLVCHFAFAALLLLVPCRVFFSDTLHFYLMAVVHIGFGYTLAASSIAFTTEMLSLLPPRNKSLSSSLGVSLSQAGISLAGLIASKMLDFGMLSPAWSACNRTFSSFDTIFIACGIMVLLLIVTLGLVPSVLNVSEWDAKAVPPR